MLLFACDEESRPRPQGAQASGGKGPLPSALLAFKRMAELPGRLRSVLALHPQRSSPGRGLAPGHRRVAAEWPGTTWPCAAFCSGSHAVRSQNGTCFGVLRPFWGEDSTCGGFSPTRVVRGCLSGDGRACVVSYSASQRFGPVGQLGSVSPGGHITCQRPTAQGQVLAA